MKKDNLNTIREQVITLRQNNKPNHRQPWTKAEHLQLAVMYHNGVGISEMAVTFKRSENSIMNQINQLGLIHRTRAANKGSDECKCPLCSRFGNCPTTVNKIK